MPTYKHKSGRIWFQRQKFASYELLLPYGMTDITDPKGAINAIREPSASQRGASEIVDIIRAEADIPGFSIETRLRKTLNYLIGQNCAWNFQAHMGVCGRADNYVASEIGLHWEQAYRGDGTLDRAALIEGDDNPVGVTIPYNSRYPFAILDFTVEFLSARTIAESEAITDMYFLGEECFEDCQSQEDNGENGYAVTEALSGSPLNVANVWYTADKGQTWTEVNNGVTRPFGGGENISCVVAMGEKNDHRVIVSRGTTDAGNPAEIAYADVTSMGNATWVTVDVGSVNGQYITYMFWQDYTHLYAITDDGYVYMSDDGGATWSALATNLVNQLNDISALADGTIWVVGNGGTIYLSTDFGVSFNAETDPSGGNNLTSITVTPDGTIFVLDNAGAIYGAYDNVVDANSWSTLAAQGVMPTNGVRVRHSNDSVIWLIVDLADSSSRVLRSTDGGANFRLWSLNLPTNSGLEAIFPCDPNLVYVGGQPHGGTAFISRTNPQVIGF